MTKNLKILVLILFLILLGIGIFFYTLLSKSSPPAPIDQNGPTQAQRDTAITEMKARIVENPPVSQSERDKALQDLKSRMK